MLELLLNNDFLSAIIAFALILIPAIIIHEFGHFLAAKMVGINVLEFGIGFPPRMVKLFQWGETEFTLNWLPIGGFVRPLGEDMIGPTTAEESSASQEDQEKAKNEEDYISEREILIERGVPEEELLSVNEAKPLPRIFFMLAGALANGISAVFFFFIMALLGIPVEDGARMQLYQVPQGTVFDQEIVLENDVIEEINGEKFQSPAEFFQQWTALADQEIVVTMRHIDNYERYELTVQHSVTDARAYVFVQSIAADSPAHEVGLEAGDFIVAVNGEALSLEDPVGDLQRLTDEYAGRELNLSVLRDGELYHFTPVPRLETPAGQGRLGIGVSGLYESDDGVQFGQTATQITYVPLPVGDAVSYGFSRTAETIQLILSIPGQLIDGTITPEQARPVSIVGISQIGAVFLQRSIRDGAPSQIVEFLALISIFLGVTNLLPLPPLDGGRILFVIIEMVRGKPVPQQVEYMVYRIGIVMLLSLGVIIIIYDIFNPII